MFGKYIKFYNKNLTKQIIIIKTFKDYFIII